MPNLQILSTRVSTYRGSSSLPLPKVADTVFAEANARDYTRDEWEAALDEAKQRAEPDENEWPLIIVDDFR